MWWDYFFRNAWRDRYNKSQDALDECYKQRNSINEALCECESTLDMYGNPEPVPVVQDKDKVIWSGFKFEVAVMAVPDCDFVHFPMDGRYWLADKAIWQFLIAWDWTNKKKYIADLYDCENYAISFKAHCDRYFGLNSCAIVIDYGSGHSYNMIFYPDGSCDIFEPQSDAFISIIGRDKSMYGLQQGAILV